MSQRVSNKNTNFNNHFYIPGDSDAISLLDLLASMGLEQHVDKPVGTFGHTLDLIITDVPILCYLLRR